MKEINSISDTVYSIINDNSSTFRGEMCGDCGNCLNKCDFGYHITSNSSDRPQYEIVSGGGD